MNSIKVLLILFLCNTQSLATAGAFITPQKPLPKYFQQLKDKMDSDQGFGLVVDGKKIKVKLITRAKLPDFFLPVVNFEGVRQYFKKMGRNVVFLAVGAYHDDQINLEGFALNNGESVGYSEIFARHTGLIEIEKGKFSLHYLPDLSATSRKSLIEKAKTKKADMFQQHFAIRNGEPTATRFNKPDFEAVLRYKMRFLVEYKNGKEGIVQLEKQFTWAEAMKVLLEHSVKNATYLDMGSLSKGAIFYADNSLGLTGDTNHNSDPGRFNDASGNFTNLLVFYSQASRKSY